MALPNLTKADIQAAITVIEAIDEPLRGGQKLVFPCTISGERYALKVMLTNPSQAQPDDADQSGEQDDEVTARARREVEIMGRCTTPYLVRLGPILLTQAEIKGQSVVYFTEEWIDGRNLGDILEQDGPLPIAELIQLGKNITEAIRELWSLQKIHRDIKPGNIMRRDANGEFVLLDMGLAFDLEDESLTVLGGLPGTSIYFSPERVEFAKKRQMDFRSDLFSLGIVLYEATTGHHPFWRRGMDSMAAVGRILTVPPFEPPSAYRQEVPTELEAAILRLLAKRPHLRYRTCEQLITALESVPIGR